MKYKDLSALKVVWKTEADHNPKFLSSEEEAIAASISHPSRNMQFTLGRQALKDALHAAGFTQQASISKGRKGEPLLPDGFSGSVSHSGNSAVAAVAKKSDFLSVGIDIEYLSRRFNENMFKSIAGENEIKWLRQSDTDLRVLMLVTAKEAFYKMLYPLCKKYFGMLDVELTWDESTKTFESLLLKDLSEGHLAGSKYQINSYPEDDFLISYCVLCA